MTTRRFPQSGELGGLAPRGSRVLSLPLFSWAFPSDRCRLEAGGAGAVCVDDELSSVAVLLASNADSAHLMSFSYPTPHPVTVTEPRTVSDHSQKRKTMFFFSPGGYLAHPAQLTG